MRRLQGSRRVMRCALSETVDVSAIIVSYNTRQMTLDCLQALVGELKNFKFEILVADNASSDGSAQAIRAAFPSVRVIESERNLGFGGGNNLAMKEAAGRYFLLINTDAIVHAGAVQKLVEHMDSHMKVAVVGPRLLNGDGSLQPSCYRFPSPGRAWAENLFISSAFGTESILGDYRRWQHDRERIVDWVIGACCLVRRQVYEQVGGFDERFFMYAEETDWQRRMCGAGWDIGFTPAAEVTHLGGASGAGEKPKINRHFFASLDRYGRKHHGLSGLISVRAAMVVGCMLRLMLWTGVLALVPAGRAMATHKVRLMSWLLWRQTTHWRMA
jgi:GT2 family glycosyltransferase